MKLMENQGIVEFSLVTQVFEKEFRKNSRSYDYIKNAKKTTKTSVYEG